MNSNQNLELLQIISEKVLPGRIKNVVWNNKVDIIIINCGNYFEVHRIGFKHEEIYKKEEKVEIKEIKFLDKSSIDDISICVILQDSTVYYVSLATCEVTLKTKIKKQENFTDIIAENIQEDEKENLHNNFKFSDKNPFKSELNFNSFSKIDISHLTFLQNNFDFSPSFIYNHKTNEIEFYLKFLINFANTKLNKNVNFLKSNKNYILLSEAKNPNSLDFHIIPYNSDISSFSNTFYQIFYSIQIVDYITNILNIVTKITHKLSINFFDKFIFANSLEHELNEDNEELYKNQLHEQLKKLFHLGHVSNNLKELMKKDLFEGKSILKMDENIYFNLKNIEDIFVENIKPSLNTITYYINEVKFGIEKICSISDIEDIFHTLYIKFEHFITDVSNMKNGYRNFLTWINNFNNASNSNNFSEASKNYLNAFVIDYDSAYNFIEEKSYNMRQILDLMEKDRGGEEITLMSFDGRGFLAKNKLVMDYLQENNLENFSENNQDASEENKSDLNSRLCIKSILFELKDKLSKLKNNLSDKLGEKIKLNQLFSVKKIPDMAKIKNIKFSNSVLMIRYTDESNNIDCLTLIKIITEDTFSVLNLNLTFENVLILDYELHRTNDLLLLAKSSVADSSDKILKYSLIVSDLDNYRSWKSYAIPSIMEICEIDLITTNEEVIKIDKLSDVDCSDSSFISSGGRGLVSIVDNKKNKIIIVDLLLNQ